MISLTQSLHKCYYIVFLAIACNKVYGQLLPPNLCPKYFSYIEDGKNIHGSIKLEPRQLHERFEVNVNFSLPGKLLSNYSGEIKLSKTQENQFNKLLDRIPLIYKVIFPREVPIPYLTSIEVNGQVLCTGPPATGGIVTKINLRHTIFPTILQNSPFPFLQKSRNCGIPIPTIEASLIAGGKDIEGESWPWLAAILENTKTNEKFICGGTLVSPNAVITSAHCVLNENGTIPHDQLFVKLGHHNIINLSEDGMKRIGVRQVVAHPDFLLGMGYDADIAVLALQDNVEYTNHIRPICLPSMPRNIIGLNGKVAGWGKTGIGIPIPTSIKLEEQRIASEIECVQSKPSFKNLIASRTFCARTRGGSGSCVGDSGGYFAILIDGRWTLFGTLSTPADIDCKLNKYAIYCNVSEYLNWLQKYIT